MAWNTAITILSGFDRVVTKATNMVINGTIFTSRPFGELVPAYSDAERLWGSLQKHKAKPRMDFIRRSDFREAILDGKMD